MSKRKMEANKQGSFYKSIKITRNEESFSHMILRNEFLKKTENYTCMVRDFITNVTPALNNSSDEVAFQIFRRGGSQDDVFDGQGVRQPGFPAYWRIEDTQFKPTPYHSTIEFLRQAQQFFHKFGFLVRRIGTKEFDAPAGDAGTVGTIHGQAEREFGYPFLRNVWADDGTGTGQVVDKGWSMLADEGRIVTGRMKSDGVFELEMTADFATEFYIVVGAETQRLLGLDPLLYVVRANDGSQSPTADLIETVLNDIFVVEVDNVVIGTSRLISRNAMHQLDERLSVDVVGTLPISNKVFSHNGGEEHEYVLARFPINDYNRFETTLQSTANRITEHVTVAESVNVGLEDLTRRSPSSSNIFMLPGTIQQLNFQLWTRYYSSGEVVRQKTKMGNGFWTLTLLFQKKV